ncbi:MAG: hypothetical protein QG670_860 [Thermoproteota archaeon]|nr:hypothetical protein [Thermoproteota archaeon]
MKVSYSELNNTVSIETVEHEQLALLWRNVRTMYIDNIEECEDNETVILNLNLYQIEEDLKIEDF